MTRETKIGLLVGLGFIVVFAVLLSHNGSGPSPTQGLPPIAQQPRDSMHSGSAAVLTDTNVGNPDSHVTPPAEPAGSGPELRDPTSGLADAGSGRDLPSPIAFKRTGMDGGGAPADNGDSQPPSDVVAMGTAQSEIPLEGTMSPSRTAPPVVEPPKPTPVEEVRPPTPSETPEPGSTAAPETPAVASGNTGDSSDGHAIPAPTKPYVVQKGDSLVKIARAVYGKSSPDVITFVEKANKLKDRNSLKEGQKLMTPPLPPSMFETRTASTAGGAELKKVEGLINGTAVNRRAPDSKAEDTAEKKAGDSAPKPADGGAAKLGKPSLPLGGPVQFIKIGAERKAGQQTSDGSADQQPAGEKSADSKSEKAEKAGGNTEKTAGAKTKTDGKGDKPKRSDKPGMRWYEIQPKDTFSSIAQRELGSKNRWAEIRQMNRDIDPAKMKPGMKIRIPSRDPLSADLSSKRASA